MKERFSHNFKSNPNLFEHQKGCLSVTLCDVTFVTKFSAKHLSLYSVHIEGTCQEDLICEDHCTKNILGAVVTFNANLIYCGGAGNCFAKPKKESNLHVQRSQ